MSNKRIFLWGTVVVGLFLIVLAIVKTVDSSQGPSNDLIPEINEITALDQFKGNRDAAATLVEYSDFQCPACRSYYPMVKQLAEEVGDDVTIVYRHFPLTSIHPNAEPAARAAEAAALQGKFWDMHDMLFEKQRFWSEERDPKQLFVRYASDLGLNTEQFESDISTGAVRDKVDNDRRSGARAAVNGTPTFFLNGQRLDNPRSYDELRTAILGQ